MGSAGVLDAVRDFAPEVARRAPEIEAARRLPRCLVATLKRAGVFRCSCRARTAATSSSFR
jgi:hypothetical protein